MVHTEKKSFQKSNILKKQINMDTKANWEIRKNKKSPFHN